MEEEATPGSSGTNQVQRDSTQKAPDKDTQKTQDDSEEKPKKTKGIDPTILKTLLSETDSLYRGGFKRPKDRLEYVCQDFGLQFRKSDPGGTGCFFTAVCDQLNRLNKSPNSAPREQYSPHFLRKELVNFLVRPKNRVYEGTNGQINLEDNLGEGKTIENWLTKMGEEDAKVDHVAVIAMAILTQRNIMLITSAPDSTLADPNNRMTKIPAITEKSFDIADCILLGYYGKSRFVSLDQFVDQIGTKEMSKKIRLTDKHSVEGYQKLYEDSEKINVKETLASREPNNTVAKQPTKKFGTMIRKTQTGLTSVIQPGKPYYIDDEMEAKSFPFPVFRYEANEGELTVKWQWHNDKRHVATTIQVAGVEFIDRGGVTWCPSKIVHNEKVVNCKQCVWVHNRIDKKESQVIDCLIPCEEYRIFLVDHFRTTMYTDTIERTTSDMMYYTPAPDPLELTVIDSFINEEVMIQWTLKNKRSLAYIDSVELCIQNGITKQTCVPPQRNDTLQKCFVLKEIKENIKVNVKVKAGQLSDEVELVIMHSPKARRPQLDRYGYWTGHTEKNFEYSIGNIYYEKLPWKRVASKAKNMETDIRIAAVIRMHKLRCGALACQLESQQQITEQPSPLSPQQRSQSPPLEVQVNYQLESQRKTTVQPSPSSPQQRSQPPPLEVQVNYQLESQRKTTVQPSPSSPQQRSQPPPLEVQTEHAYESDGRHSAMPGEHHFRIPLSCRIDDNSVLIGNGDGNMVADLTKEENRDQEKENCQREKFRQREDERKEEKNLKEEEKLRKEDETRIKEKEKRREKEEKHIEEEEKRMEREEKRIEEEKIRKEAEKKRREEEEKRIEKEEKREKA
ncbi:uncharacterized protein LOC110450337 [Mizuhopecten yessoensis]|uniref:uncharacterized protein LOC110450337 n=1 Tax=Mizuhopecten yessoensis TaxID=6573 RepID=UPI000B45F4EF|nr:uncharacterized protein LOC110450337 [Mizuhopecten yessoensis]